MTILFPNRFSPYGFSKWWYLSKSFTTTVAVKLFSKRIIPYMCVNILFFFFNWVTIMIQYWVRWRAMKERIYVYIQLIHFVVQLCKATTPQLKQKKAYNISFRCITQWLFLYTMKWSPKFSYHLSPYRVIIDYIPYV